MNFFVIRGKEIRVSRFDRNMVKQDKTNIFVNNLGSNVTHKKLYELFAPFGEIFSCKLAKDLEEKSKGFGFVQFKEIASTEKAIKEMDGKEFEGRKLKVAPYKKRDPSERAATTYNNIYVKNLPPSIKAKDTLSGLFSKYGEQISTYVSSSTLNGKENFYGFVCFKDPAAAAKAVEEMNNHEIEGVVLYVAKAVSKDQRAREKYSKKEKMREESRKFTLYVKSIMGEPLNEALIREKLGFAGEIKSVSIPVRTAGLDQPINGPVAFVVFTKEEEAQKAARENHAAEFEVNPLESKEQRREKRKNVRGPGISGYGSMFPGAFPMASSRMPWMGGMPYGRGGRRPMRGDYQSGRSRGPRQGTRMPFNPVNYMRPEDPAFMGPGGPMPMMPPMYQMRFSGHPNPMMPPRAMPPFMAGMPGMPGMSGMPGMPGMPVMSGMPVAPMMSFPGAPPPQMGPSMPAAEQSEEHNTDADPRERFGEELYNKIVQLPQDK